MGVTKSGPEHALMDRMWARGIGEPVVVRLPMPDDGLWTPKDRAGDKKPNRYSLNQDWCRATNWLLDAVFDGGEVRKAVGRAHHIHAVQREFGHWCSGEGGKTEFGAGSHRQIYYADMAGELLAAKLLGEDALLGEVTQAWRLETAMGQRCYFVEGDETHMLIPQARAGEPTANRPRGSALNPAMDELMAGLLSAKGLDDRRIDEWRLPARTPKVGSYSAAVPLLKKAFAAGVDPRTLIGDDGDLERIPARLGWHLKGGAPGDYYAWFDNLGFVYDGLHGAGFVNGEVVLKWTRDEAVEYGEALQL